MSPLGCLTGMPRAAWPNQNFDLPPLKLIPSQEMAPLTAERLRSSWAPLFAFTPHPIHQQVLRLMSPVYPEPNYFSNLHCPP